HQSYIELTCRPTAISPAGQTLWPPAYRGGSIQILILSVRMELLLRTAMAKVVRLLSTAALLFTVRKDHEIEHVRPQAKPFGDLKSSNSFYLCWCARLDLNQRPSAPETNGEQV